MLEACPHCAAPLTDDGERLELGHEMRGIYDGVLFWSCPKCGLAWSRFGQGHRLWITAQKWVDLYNQTMQPESQGAQQ